MDFTQLVQHRPKTEVTSQWPGETLITIDPRAFASALVQAVSSGREAQHEERADLQRQLEETRRLLAKSERQRLVDCQKQLAEYRAETQALRQDSARQLQEANRRSEAQQGPLQGLSMTQRQPPRSVQHTPKWSVVGCLPCLVSRVKSATYHNHHIYAVMVTSNGEQQVCRFPVQDLASARWEVFGVPACGRVNCHGFVSHVGNLYTLCASENHTVYELHKMVNGNWVYVTHLPEREHFAFGVANSKLFIIGGKVGNCAILNVHSFSLTALVWESWPDLPSHGDSCFVGVGTQVYLFPPWEEKEGYVLSIDTGAGCHYRSQTALPATAYPGACRLHSTVAIAGGVDCRSATEASSGPSCTTSAFILDRDTNQWTPLASLNMQRARPHLLFDSDHNRLICFGGFSDRSGILSNTMEVLQLSV